MWPTWPGRAPPRARAKPPPRARPSEVGDPRVKTVIHCLFLFLQLPICPFSGRRVSSRFAPLPHTQIHAPPISTPLFKKYRLNQNPTNEHISQINADEAKEAVPLASNSLGSKANVVGECRVCPKCQLRAENRVLRELCIPPRAPNRIVCSYCAV